MARLNWQGFSVARVPSALPFLGAQAFDWFHIGTLSLNPYICEGEQREFDCGYFRMRLGLSEADAGARAGKNLLPLMNAPSVALTANDIIVLPASTGSSPPPRIQILLRIDEGDQAPPFDLIHTIAGGHGASGIIWGRRISIYGILFDNSDTISPAQLDTTLWCSFVGCDPGEAGGREFVAIQDVQGVINQVNPICDFIPALATTGCSFCLDLENIGVGQTVEIQMIDETPSSKILCRRVVLQSDEPRVSVWPARVQLLRFVLIGVGPAPGDIPVNVAWLQGNGYGFG